MRRVGGLSRQHVLLGTLELMLKVRRIVLQRRAVERIADVTEASESINIFALFCFWGFFGRGTGINVSLT